MTQAHILYSGTVQGVGFRCTAQRYAQDLDLKGWIKNLSDGRVEILAEGPQKIIEEFCQKTDNHFQGYIDEKKITQRPAEGKFSDFRIVY